MEAQKELTGILPRLARVPQEVADDAISEGMVDVIVAFDPVEIATAAHMQNISIAGQIAILMKRSAQKHLGREKKNLARSVSDDTPLGEDDSELHLRDLFIPRQNSAERIENYAEWMMFARRGGCPFSIEEINDLFGLSPV